MRSRREGDVRLNHMILFDPQPSLVTRQLSIPHALNTAYFPWPLFLFHDPCLLMRLS